MSSPVTPSPLDSQKFGSTRTEVLNAAEVLFAQHGLDAVSVRDITTAAKANLASVNYHFGSKQGLVIAVMERRIIPLNEMRIQALYEARQIAGDEPIPLEVLLDAFIRPVVQMSLDVNRGGLNFLKMMGRMFSEPGASFEDFLLELCEPLFQHFDKEWHRALPELTMDEIYWRVSFTHGALNHWLLTIDKPVLGRIKFVGTLEDQIQRLIQFSAAGLRSPMPAGLVQN